MTAADVNGLVAQYQRAIIPAAVAAITGQVDAVTTESLVALADELGVTIESLYRLGIGWDGSAWTFPVYDSTLTPLGIHRRFPGDGRKVYLRGSRIGIFSPTRGNSGNSNTSPAGGVENEGCVTTTPPAVPPSVTTLLVCEGMSDTAAALSLGYDAVGLPAAGQAIEVVSDLAIRLRPNVIVIVADLDQGVALTTGETIWPGIEGGLRLAERLMPLESEVRFCLPPPGVKDLREWYQRSPDAEIRSAIAAAPRVHGAWLNAAWANVRQNQRATRQPPWSRRAAALLASIADDELRAELRERFEERAAVIEHEANLPRDEAERLAFEELARKGVRA
jgi:hypothetical protein